MRSVYNILLCLETIGFGLAADKSLLTGKVYSFSAKPLDLIIYFYGVDHGGNIISLES